MTNTLKPCFMRISMSLALAGKPQATLNSLHAESTCWMGAFPGLLVEHAFTGSAGRRKDAAQGAGAGPQDADALHCGNLANVREAFFALDDRPVDQLAVGIERPHVGALLELSSEETPYAGASPTASGRVPPFDVKRMAAIACRTCSALSTAGASVR